MSPRKKEDFEKMQAVSKEKILNAALELFVANGYTNTTVDGIAKKAKISKGLIYHYFSSKQAILKSIFGVLMQNLNQFMEASEGLPPKEYIRKMVAFSFQFIITQSEINRFVIALAVQPKVVAGLHEDLEKAKQSWMKQLALMFENLNYSQPEAEAYLLGAIFDGVSIGYQVFGKDYPIEEIKKIIIKKYKL